MAGVVTRRHFFLIARELGIAKALRVLLSREPVALATLMS